MYGAQFFGGEPSVGMDDVFVSSHLALIASHLPALHAKLGAQSPARSSLFRARVGDRNLGRRGGE